MAQSNEEEGELQIEPESVFKKKYSTKVLNCLIDKGDLSFGELKKETGLRDEQLDRCLKVLKKADFIKKVEERWKSNIKDDILNIIKPFLILASEMKDIKTKQKLSNKISIESVSNLTDIELIKAYNSKVTLAFPQTRIYGLNKENYKSKNPQIGSSKTLYGTKAVKEMKKFLDKIKKPKEQFRANYKRTLNKCVMDDIEETMKIIIEALLNQKREYVATVVKQKLRLRLKRGGLNGIKTIISKNIGFWTNYLSRGEINKKIAKFHIFNQKSVGWELVDYNKKEHVKLVRFLLKKKERKIPIKSLKKKYPLVYYIQSKEIPYDLYKWLYVNPDTTKKLKLLKLIEGLANELRKEGLYPIRVAVVAHSTPRSMISFLPKGTRFATI